MLIVAGFIAIAYALVCTSVLLLQNRLIFCPSSGIENTPADFGLPYEELWLPISNKGKVEKIHSWWIPSDSPDSKVMLYLHGNACNIGSYLEIAQRLHQVGLSLLLIDYRGYGCSEGKFPRESQLYQDAQVGWDYLVQQRGINPQDIFVYGYSLGGAIGIDLAVRNPEMAGLILEGSFTSMRDMADYEGKYGFLPINLLLTQRFDSINKIKSIQTPIFLIHAINDTTVPARMSQVLFDAATVPKQLWLVPDAGHNDLTTVATSEYQHKIREFVTQVYAEKAIA
ncbi:phospholipase [Moorena producens PAL-8-15-08-1]|uniref:Phospholipase n=1 Tax=Moorena producens PAL-8-15-08-1 TaxID=1458985 RepID=A0A1D8TM61_9CYAN|nr:alpha/beta fold hydrolase [Moorena producens]AOW98740.1 phospholipase [Moorena producens PAL-8-15-08-1]